MGDAHRGTLGWEQTLADSVLQTSDHDRIEQSPSQQLQSEHSAVHASPTSPRSPSASASPDPSPAPTPTPTPSRQRVRGFLRPRVNTRSQPPPAIPEVVLPEQAASPEAMATPDVPPPKRRRTSSYRQPLVDLALPHDLTQDEQRAIDQISKISRAQVASCEAELKRLDDRAADLAKQKELYQASMAAANKSAEDTQRGIGALEKRLKSYEEQQEAAENIAQSLLNYRSLRDCDADAAAPNERGDEDDSTMMMRRLQQDRIRCEEKIIQLKDELQKAGRLLASWGDDKRDAERKMDEIGSQECQALGDASGASGRLKMWTTYHRAISLGPQNVFATLQNCGKCTGTVQDLWENTERDEAGSADA